MKISVITAVYNSEGTVGEAIDSIARQTYPNVQHVIIEGQSADGSLAAIERAAHDRMELDRIVLSPDSLMLEHQLSRAQKHLRELLRKIGSLRCCLN